MEKPYWIASRTTGNNRVNLFSISGQTSHHIATIISGSMSELERFDRSVSIIEASPKMLILLDETLQLLNDFSYVQSPNTQELEKRIKNLLAELACNR